MPQKSFISGADAALANFVWSCIEKDSKAKAVISSKKQILFSSPKTIDTQGTGKLSLFLYNIVEGACESNESTQKSFVLSYLVTPFTGNDKDDHLLVGKIIQMVSGSPVINPDDSSGLRLSVKKDSLSFDELTKLWIALGASLRPSVSLTVFSGELQNESPKKMSSANKTPQLAAAETDKVTQLYQAVLKTFTEQSKGWMKRNVFLKQWFLQNFKKNTDMTVDEANTMLKDLGDKLERHQSTEPFIDPMNKLCGYYELQVEQLKGMQKISSNQKENIEIINSWITEIKNLVEALGG